MIATCPHEDRFLEMLPQIRTQARFAFRDEPRSRRQELISEVIANCWAAFVRLVERGRIDIVYPTPLAQFAIRQVRVGRKVGGKLNVRDVSSVTPSAARASPWRTWTASTRRIRNGRKCWSRTSTPDLRKSPHHGSTSPPGCVCCRNGCDASPKRWPRARPRKRRPSGFTFRPGRISQLRRELQQKWEDFQGDFSFA